MLKIVSICAIGVLMGCQVTPRSGHMSRIVGYAPHALCDALKAKGERSALAAVQTIDCGRH